MANVSKVSWREKTSIFFSTYDPNLAEKVLSEIRSKFRVLESSRSSVVRELYYVSIEGSKEREVTEILRGYGIRNFKVYVVKV